ncbi:hypothetical protein Plec18167_005418 [Paecilomyces lecythidis]|uniref:Fungal-specific transcription factor domain-containing protein n=1 Tax=Paecilomyces lecythidis TaxID=3004212 RepID=A0ABR3XK85_9EURO
MDSGPSGTLDYPEMASQIFGDTFSTPHPCPTPTISSYEGPTTSSLQKPILSLMADQHQELLRLYDTEFCVLPITSDTSLNPFRYSQETSNGSRLLFHAILAICCQHLNRITGNWATEVEEHRVQAANLLNDALQQEQLARMGLALLDPILVIFTLDCTLSAAGPWVKHLNQIRSIIEFCGGPCALDKPRIRSQVGMFLWWDATLALISRQGTVLSRDYLDHLACSERDDGWSFYDLTGCPSDLFIILFHLAELAKQNEIACNMTWLTFDPTPVKQVEHQIHNWDSDAFAEPCCSRPSNVYNSSESDSETDDVTMEEAMHAQQDRYHCAEAWRHALLIYIERVLKWDRKSPRPKSLNKLIRSVLNHVRCCRRTSLTQKQLLLPVFLAGSETRDEEMRDLAISYCKWWGSRSRYSMFDSVSDLLKEVWAEDTPNSPRTYWWGTVVDRKTRLTKPGQIPTQFLFG